MNNQYEGDLINNVYDKLFDNDSIDLDFCLAFQDAEVNREFAYIKLNDSYALKLERI